MNVFFRIYIRFYARHAISTVSYSGFSEKSMKYMFNDRLLRQKRISLPIRSACAISAVSFSGFSEKWMKYLSNDRLLRQKRIFWIFLSKRHRLSSAWGEASEMPVSTGITVSGFFLSVYRYRGFTHSLNYVIFRHYGRKGSNCIMNHLLKSNAFFHNGGIT